MAGDEATVTAADIARMAGVGRAAVSNWRKRHEDFPEPVGGTATSPAFSLEAVEAWLLEQGKVAELPLRERVWQQIRAASDDLRLGESVAEATELLHRGGKPRTLPASVWKLVRGYAREEGEAQAVRFLLDRYADVHSRRLAETPAEVADLMARLAGPDVRSVLDPACGLGMLLAALSDVEHLYGQEQEDSLARLAQSRLALSAAGGTVRTGDSLREDAWPGLTVDAVVCHPPFNERNWGYDELTSDPRWEYGLPPKAESELAWVQHALAHLEPGGIAVLLMPATAANRRSGRRIRSNLLRSGTLQAVIGLPPKVASGTGLPVHVWVLRKPSGDHRTPSRVLMAEADPGDVDAIVERWHEFRADPERDLDRPGESRTVPIIDLVDEDVDVTPARHLGVRDEVPADTYVLLRERLIGQFGRLSTLVPEAVPGAGRELPTVGLAELERVGALAVQQAGRFEIDGVGDPVLTDRQVFDGEPAETRTRPEGRITAEPGDVVVAARGNTLATLVVETPGLLLGPRLTLLRPDPARLDPFFLAGFIRGLSSAATVGTQSGATRFDPRRAQVPRLSPREQKRYGDVFRQAFAFEAALRELSASGHLTVNALTQGLTRGTLTPPESIS
ncbi:N-6 DNA methylase [Streptosporangium carneum]|uniref:SAM-dependent methyltransferase n=1 Tax=Streptosporangium carneum TaxID=47481 RepID=A0A9W6IAM9_9ACTN|nr:N-6 DNA methylase [Streptosporangium carneum]GLK15180.1 SAM-dependent methyltransferase [Streptosporangium carneum]